VDFGQARDSIAASHSIVGFTGAVPVALSNEPNATSFLNVFSVSQLTDPEKAYKRAGMITA
jgi:hypothetical protein